MLSLASERTSFGRIIPPRPVIIDPVKDVDQLEAAGPLAAEGVLHITPHLARCNEVSGRLLYEKRGLDEAPPRFVIHASLVPSGFTDGCPA